MLHSHTQRERPSAHRIEIDVRPEVKENGKNVQIKISHECHTERNGRSNTVLLLSLSISPFVLAFVVMLQPRFGLLFDFFLSSNTLIFIKRDK